MGFTVDQLLKGYGLAHLALAFAPCSWFRGIGAGVRLLLSIAEVAGNADSSMRLGTWPPPQHHI